jgi:uncharacterized protein (DUF1499 family)
MKQQSSKPGLVKWTGYLAITVLVALPVAVLAVRSGAWQQGLMLYSLSCLGASLLLLLSVVLLLLPRFASWRKAIAGCALMALPGTLLLLSVIASRGDYPPIHDITTDTDNPPEFTMAEQQRGAGANALEINLETVSQQQKAYLDLQTILSDLSLDEAFDRAVQVANAMGWEIYHQDRNAGVIEAVDTTAIMAFQDDIVIRVRSNAQGTLLDLRSVSRVGVGDIGANAKRIRAFQQRFNG